MVGAGVEGPPIVIAGIAQVEALTVVIGHVHALIGKVLVGDVLHRDFQLEQVVVMAQADVQRVVLCLVGGGADFVASQPAAILRGGAGRLETATGLVVVGFSGGAGITHGEDVAGDGGGEVDAARIVVAAVKRRSLAFHQQLIGRCSELRRGRIDGDGAGNAVAAHADRRDTGEHLDLVDVGGIDVGKRRIHVVGTGRDQVHAVDLDADAVIGQAVDGWQAGNAAGAI